MDASLAAKAEMIVIINYLFKVEKPNPLTIGVD